MRRVWRAVAVMGLVALGAGIVAPAHAASAPGAAQARQQTEDWRCVEINGQTELNIRSGPGINYAILTALPPGTRLDGDYSRLDSTGGYNWVAVRYTGGEGWAITGRLSPCVSDYDDPGHDVVLDSVDQDGTLDRFEIAAISRSVVLVANIQNRRIDGTGTGTIITPDGLILTNAHVVEDADDIAIALLDDINDPPTYRYYGDVIGYDADVDVALIAIRYDSDGNAVHAADLNLPYLPVTLASQDVFRGDSVTIFGYPGIGDDYLVVTTGTIVSVENGDLGNQRMPVWYRTDAEIAPGSSGGLVVNTNGEFVGIPTFVRSETETGGRLGGIRPAQVALSVVLDDADLAAASNLPAQPDAGAVPTTADPIQIRVKKVTLDHGTVVNGEQGIRIHVSFVMDRWPGQDAVLGAWFFHDDVQSTPLVNPAAPESYRDFDDSVGIWLPLTPCCEAQGYEDLTLFIPYQAFGLNQPGTYPLKVELAVTSTDRAWQRILSWEYITFTLQ